MLIRTLPGFAFVAVALIVGTGCGTTSAMPGPPNPQGGPFQTSAPTMPPTSPPTAPPTNPPASCAGTNSVLFVNQAQGQTIGLPAVCGFAGSVNVPSNSFPVTGPFDKLDVAVDVPVGNVGPPAPAGTTTGVLSLTVSPGGILGAGGFQPGLQLAVTLPSTIPTWGKSFVMAACSYGGNVGTPPTCSGTVLVKPSVNGQTLTFNDPSGFSIRRVIHICFPPPHGPPPHCPPGFVENFVANIYYTDIY